MIGLVRALLLPITQCVSNFCKVHKQHQHFNYEINVFGFRAVISTILRP